MAITAENIWDAVKSFATDLDRNRSHKFAAA